jgi:transcriptional regulator with XRE-family HTH domain
MGELSVQYDAKEFGRRLRKIRKRNKMTQEQLAEILYLSVDSISNFENGKSTCMPEHLTKICQIFNISADYFYFEVDSPLNKGDTSDFDNIIKQLQSCSEFDIGRINQMIQILLAQPTV